MASHAATTLAAPTVLEDRGRRWGEAPEGFSQGEPWSSGNFCLSWQEMVVELDEALSQEGGMARLIMDDAYGVGPGHVLFPAIMRFEERIRRECGLVLQRTKCEVFSWSGVMPVNPIPGFTLAGTMVEDTFQPRSTQPVSDLTQAGTV